MASVCCMPMLERAKKCEKCGKSVGYLFGNFGFQLHERIHAIRCQLRGSSWHEHCDKTRHLLDSSDALGSRWIDDASRKALSLLLLEDQRASTNPSPHDRLPSNWQSHCRLPLPPEIYSEVIATFLRFDHPLPNMLYAFGGRQKQEVLSNVEMFDTWYGRWVACPSMPSRRAGASVATLPDGRFIITGGYDERGFREGILSSCEVYNPRIPAFEQRTNPMLRARWGHDAACVGGKIYVVGGCLAQPSSPGGYCSTNACEVYDPVEDTWLDCAPLCKARSGHKIVTLGDRFIIAVGGFLKRGEDNSFHVQEVLSSAEVLDIWCGRWILLDDQPRLSRSIAAVAALGDQKLLVAGGRKHLEHGCAPESSAEIFQLSLASSECTQRVGEETTSIRTLGGIAGLPSRRSGCHAMVINLPGKNESFPKVSCRSVVVVGGENEMGEFVTDIPVFDIGSGAWRCDVPVPAMRIKRKATAMCVGHGWVVARPDDSV